MDHTHPPNAPHYHAYLLRLWCDADGQQWHASLQAPNAIERRGFTDLDQLIAFLRDLCCSATAALPIDLIADDRIINPEPIG